MRGVAREHDASAGLGVGQREVMLKLNAEVLADGGQVGAPELKGPARELHRAEHWQGRERDASAETARLKDLAIEASVVGGQEVGALDHLRDRGPVIAEDRLLGDVLPGDAMHPREDERAARRADEEVVPRVDLPLAHIDERERTGRVCSVVGGLEVERDKTPKHSRR